MSIDLIDFLENKMSMTQYYQPVMIAELLEHGGKCSKDQLAASLALYDESVLEYYKKIVMVWPKATLEKHGIVSYDKHKKEFCLNVDLDNVNREKALAVCVEKLEEWQARQKANNDPSFQPATRYRVLKNAKGKCELCGTPASRRPMDVDHIVPQSFAKDGKILKDGKLIPVHSDENLQALCFKCNRAKSNKDDTDFRKSKKLVRDNIPKIIQEEGREPIIETLHGKKLFNALCDKLDEEHEEFLEDHSIDELADMVEVIFSIVKESGSSVDELMKIVAAKKQKNGGFEKGYFYQGDQS
jgi:predicted house-cleaning noncanonical NTP pyrophosphatase (MazG superfamily)|tara:strand:- start:6431 stop:7327 length:897 start_codon:yes stop_codon:yes gene_type:complete